VNAGGLVYPASRQSSKPGTGDSGPVRRLSRSWAGRCYPIKESFGGSSRRPCEPRIGPGQAPASLPVSRGMGWHGSRFLLFRLSQE